MQSVTGAGAEAGAGLGIFRGQVGPETCWLHDGRWGVQVITCPGLDVTVARSFGQAAYDSGWSASSFLLAVLSPFLGS